MTTSEKSKKAGLQSLADYIDEHYNGNRNAFATANFVTRQQVNGWLNAAKPIYVVDGKMVAAVRDLEPPR
ncbi:MAG: hypothetical protein KDA17_05925 [Candidatus Saccharibacteria bacterium]|nr:hypothetical protein [Candidatus Saccharibacteria bacterium]